MPDIRGFVFLVWSLLGAASFLPVPPKRDWSVECRVKNCGEIPGVCSDSPATRACDSPKTSDGKNERLNVPFYRGQVIFGNNLLHTFLNRMREMVSFDLGKELDPVSRVTGIPGWYWILGIKCSDTMGVGLVY